MDPIPNGGVYLQPLNMSEAGSIDTQNKNKELAEKYMK